MSTTPKTLLIVNPAAGHGRGKKVFKHLEPRLRQSFPNLDILTSEYPGHAVEIGRAAAGDFFDLVLCLGGDGTPFEVINGLYSQGRPAHRPDFGFIPAGTGNSFLRDFGIETPDAALDRILEGQRQPVDLIEFSSSNDGTIVRQYSLNIIGVGLIADILKLTNERLKPLGSLGYSLAVLLRLAKGMHNRIEIRTDSASRTIRDSALVVSNSKFTGGKMKIAPDAETADGLADLVIFREVNRREILAIFKRVFAGTHTAHPKVDIIKAAEMVIEGDPPLLLMADGEMLGRTPLRLKVLPGELSLLV